MFKTHVGKGHSEFSTAKQQDALEFIQHILSLMERKERNQAIPNDPSQVFLIFLQFILLITIYLILSQIFGFKIQEKIQCKVSGATAYKEADEKTLTLPIPVDLCTNQAAYMAYQV